MIRMIDIPAVRDLEGFLLLEGFIRDEVPAHVQQRIDRVSREVFGIVEDDLGFDVPDDFDEDDMSPAAMRIKAAADAYEAQFENYELADDQIVELLRAHGLDFSDERGHPLRCILYLAVQAEAAAKGIAGRMPDMAAINADKMASKLEDEARAFRAARRR